MEVTYELKLEERCGGGRKPPINVYVYNYIYLFKYLIFYFQFAFKTHPYCHQCLKGSQQYPSAILVRHLEKLFECSVSDCQYLFQDWTHRKMNMKEPPVQSAESAS